MRWVLFRGAKWVFLIRIKLSNSSRTPLSPSLPNNSRKKETTFLQKALLLLLEANSSVSFRFSIFLSLFGIPSRKRGLLETQRTFFDFPWVNKIKQSSSFFQHSFFTDFSLLLRWILRDTSRASLPSIIYGLFCLFVLFNFHSFCGGPRFARASPSPLILFS